MKQTTIVEKQKVEPKSAVLIEGLPGLGMVGKIATEYLVKQLGARRIAELYSRGIPFVDAMPEWKDRFRALWRKVAEGV